MQKCPICLEPIENSRKGKDVWGVHSSSGKVRCPESFKGCPVATRTHILEDGTACPDARHEKGTRK